MGDQKDAKLEQLIFGMLNRIQREKLLSERVAHPSLDIIALHDKVKNKLREFEGGSAYFDPKVRQAIVDEIILERREIQRNYDDSYQNNSDALDSSFQFDPTAKKTGRQALPLLFRRLIKGGVLGIAAVSCLCAAAITYRVLHDDIPLNCVARELTNRYLIDFEKCTQLKIEIQTPISKKLQKRKKL